MHDNMEPAALSGWCEHDLELRSLGSFAVLEPRGTIQLDMHELQHRMKNMMAVIQSISHQTMRHSATKDEFDHKFSARLSAYAKAVDLLIVNKWQGLEIHDLLLSQLGAFGISDGKQIRAKGPSLKISTNGAHNLGLALHELATNAMKYGSLSVPQGRVDISWSVRPATAGPRFHLLWQESDGPQVTPPVHLGFGHRIIEYLSAAAVAGQTNYDFLPEGVRWTLDAPAVSALVM